MRLLSDDQCHCAFFDRTSYINYHKAFKYSPKEGRRCSGMLTMYFEDEFMAQCVLEILYIMKLDETLYI